VLRKLRNASFCRRSSLFAPVRFEEILVFLCRPSERLYLSFTESVVFLLLNLYFPFLSARFTDIFYFSPSTLSPSQIIPCLAEAMLACLRRTSASFFPFLTILPLSTRASPLW